MAATISAAPASNRQHKPPAQTLSTLISTAGKYFSLCNHLFSSSTRHRTLAAVCALTLPPARFDLWILSSPTNPVQAFGWTNRSVCICKGRGKKEGHKLIKRFSNTVSNHRTERHSNSSSSCQLYRNASFGMFCGTNDFTCTAASSELRLYVTTQSPSSKLSVLCDSLAAFKEALFLGTAPCGKPRWYSSARADRFA